MRRKERKREQSTLGRSIGRENICTIVHKYAEKRKEERTESDIEKEEERK